MTSSSYSSSFGRLQSLSVNFLSSNILQNLLHAKDVSDMIRMLESTWYRAEIERAASLYSPPELLEIALNRHIVEINKIALEATPFSGKTAIRAYLLKWDIHNIELILSSKIIGRAITETEPFLVSSRNFPAGISAGNISHDEMKIILSQTGVEGVVNHLVKYRYGTILMQYLDTYQKTGDLGPMMADLIAYYYTSLIESLKFFQGDEGVVRDLFRAQIDKKNILSLLKGRDANLDRELISKHLVSGGHITLDELFDIFGSKNIDEFVNKIEKRYNLVETLKETYMKTHSLIDFEVAFDKYINKSYLKRLKNIALSLGTIFYFMIKAEYEWDNIKRIAYGKRYNLPIERINSMLILEWLNRELSSKQKVHPDAHGGLIAVIGERELVIGYRLLGIDDTFIVARGDQAFKTMENLFFSHKYTMIIASQFIRDYLPPLLRKKVEASIEPLVLFMPSLKGNIQEESISSLARRVLGININY